MGDEYAVEEMTFAIEEEVIPTVNLDTSTSEKADATANACDVSVQEIVTSNSEVEEENQKGKRKLLDKQANKKVWSCCAVLPLICD